MTKLIEMILFLSTSVAVFIVVYMLSFTPKPKLAEIYHALSSAKQIKLLLGIRDTSSGPDNNDVSEEKSSEEKLLANLKKVARKNREAHQTFERL